MLPILALVAGCHVASAPVPCAVECRLAALIPPGIPEDPEVRAASDSGEQAWERIDLDILWRLALANNPGLREAAADVESARGRWIQAGLYPNPVFRFDQDTIGSNIAAPGNSTYQVTQEVVTGGKRSLDLAVAGKETALAEVALEARKFELLARIRRGYYDYVGLQNTLKIKQASVATLERAVAVARRQVETEGTRPETDLIRLEALLEEGRISRDTTRTTLEGAWGQLAAEVGVPGLPPPLDAGSLPAALPDWDEDAVLERALAANTAVKQLAVDVDRARIAVERARAGALPNIVVGGGGNIDRTDQTAGAVITVETPLVVWNRHQGAIREAEAQLASSLAALRSVENRLAGQTADAAARYRAAAGQAKRLKEDVIPRLERSLTLTLDAYQAGSVQVTFSDVLTVEQNLNTAQLTQADAVRAAWQAVADLQGLMQLDIDEPWGSPAVPPDGEPSEFAAHP